MIATSNDIAMLRESGSRLAAILDELIRQVKPGISTKELDGLAGALILSSGGEAVFRGYRSHPGERPFPATICTSVNEEVVHGIPTIKKILREGDIISIDIGMRYPKSKGLVTDMAATVPVGNISPEAKKIIAVTERALAEGISMLKSGVRLGDLGSTIQTVIENAGYGVVKELVGHGVGRELHEEPYIPNYGKSGDGAIIQEGAVFAIEPMATTGRTRVTLARDGWTWRTADKSLAAHFEHTVIVTKEGAEVLTKLSK